MPNEEDNPLDFEPDVFDPSGKEDDDLAGVRFAITSYGADYPVDALISRLRSDAIEIPEFQRGYVWTLPQASRFIESLLLGLPVPAIFLSRDPDTQKLLVIDGQQRLTSLLRFYDGLFEGREFRLKGVEPDFEGKSIRDLTAEDKRRLDDSLLHAIIVNQTEPSGDRTGLYSIFERINTGGTPLQPQEIRWCVYYGEFLLLLRELSQNSHWQDIYGRPSKRAKDEELILRFFALYYDRERYARPMKVFLNKFVSSNRNLDRYGRDELCRVFDPTVEFAQQQLGSQAFRPSRNLNAALLEAVLVGIATRLESGPIADDADAKAVMKSLLDDTRFSLGLDSGTTDEHNVKYRMQKAIDAFAVLP